MDADTGRLRDEIMGGLAAAGDLRALDEVRVAALGKSGSVTGLVKSLGALPAERRREAGQAFNLLKREVEEALASRKAELERAGLAARLAAERLDVTLPARERPRAASTP
jgi:phenylalanyl-tRNA synthetase alpha chain